MSGLGDWTLFRFRAIENLLRKKPQKETAISGFFGEYRFLSNFWPVELRYGGEVYPSVEHAYQAAKCVDPLARDAIRNAAKPGKAKKLGSKAEMRADWEQVRIETMEELVRQKFLRNHELGEKLLATGSADLIERNDWGDTFWGVCEGNGENHLGRILMGVRAQVRKTRES